MKLLVLSAWFPFPADNGSKIRTNHLLRALCRDHEVDLAAFFEGPREAAALGEAQAMCREAAVLPKPPFEAKARVGWRDVASGVPRFVRSTYSPGLADTVRGWQNERHYDAAVCMTWGMAAYLGVGPHRKSKGGRSNGCCRAVLDQHNIESGAFRRGLAHKKGAGRIRGWLTYQKFRRYEGRVCADFAGCSVVSDVEKEELARILPARRAPDVAVIPNGVDTTKFYPRGELFSRRATAPRTFVFTGSPAYGANRDALGWFLREVWGGLRASFPGLRLKISGDYDAEFKRRAGGDDGVTFTGYVEDIRPLLWESDALVAPLRLGGGTRLKVLEAMAAGLPVISSRVGMEGLGARPGEHVLVANSPRDYISAAYQVIKEPLRTLAMVSRARALVEARYGWEAIGDEFCGFVEGIAR